MALVLILTLFVCISIIFKRKKDKKKERLIFNRKYTNMFHELSKNKEKKYSDFAKLSAQMKKEKDKKGFDK